MEAGIREFLDRIAGSGPSSSTSLLDALRTEPGDQVPSPAAQPQRSNQPRPASPTTYDPRPVAEPTTGSLLDHLRARSRQTAASMPPTPPTGPTTDALPTTGTSPSSVEAGQPTAQAPPVHLHDGTVLMRDREGVMEHPFVARGDDVPDHAPDEYQWAAEHATRALEYFSDNGRHGIENRGEPLRVRVNDMTVDGDGNEIHAGNAGYYEATDGHGELYRFLRFGRGLERTSGDGRLRDQISMAAAYDITVHELTHGIIRSETGHPGGTEDEAGAVHEGLADLMAAAATKQWIIGETAYTSRSDVQMLRDIEHPDRPDALHTVIDSVDEFARLASASDDGSVEEHVASGIISRTGFHIQQQLGWSDFEELVWATIEGGRLDDLSFANAGAAMDMAAAQLWGSSSEQRAVVQRELAKAGIPPYGSG